MARNEPSCLDLHSLAVCFIFLADLPICNNGCFRIQRWKSTLKNLDSEILAIVAYNLLMCLETVECVANSKDAFFGI